MAQGRPDCKGGYLVSSGALLWPAVRRCPAQPCARALTCIVRLKCG